MNINNFKKWLDSKGIKNELVNYGDSSYFYNAPGCTYEAATITIEADTIPGINPILKQIKNYCSRYNLDIFRECNRYNFNYVTYKYNYVLVVRTAADAAAIENYYKYQGASVNDCEMLIHEYHEAGLYKTMHKELEKQLREIMDKYGIQYNRSLIKAVKVA